VWNPAGLTNPLGVDAPSGQRKGDRSMKVKTITPKESSKSKFVFIVRFDDDAEIEMTPTQLQNYTKFQNAVMTAAGRVFYSSCIERHCEPRERTMWWREHIEYGLSLGKGEIPSRRGCCGCFVWPEKEEEQTQAA
jgi:hypothetical protein